MALSEIDYYRNEGKKRLRARVRLEASVVADRLLKMEDGIEVEFEREYDQRSKEGKIALVTEEYDEWIKARVQRRFAPVLMQEIEA